MSEAVQNRRKSSNHGIENQNHGLLVREYFRHTQTNLLSFSHSFLDMAVEDDSFKLKRRENNDRLKSYVHFTSGSFGEFQSQ